MTSPVLRTDGEFAARVMALVQSLRDTEQELETLTGGQVDAVAGLGGRLSLLREAQERLTASEATQLAILNALPAHVALLDPAGVIQSVNESWRRFATDNGFVSATCGVGESYLEVCDRAGAPESGQVSVGLRSVLAGDIPTFALEYPCDSPSGPRWFRLTATPLHDRRREGAVVMHVDITDRKQVEADLRTSEESLRLTVAAANLGLWSWNLVTNDVEYSREWKRQLGYDEHEIGHQLSEFETRLHPDDLEDVRARVAQYLEKPEGIHEMEFRIRHKDGSWRWMISRGEVLRHGDGPPAHMLGCQIDFTARKKMESDLLRAQRMESLGTLAGGIAHDLNNVLAPMLLSVEMLRETVTDEGDLELLATLSSLCHRGAGMVKQVLGFAKGVDGMRVQVDPAQVIHELRQVIQDTFPKDITLTFDPALDVRTVTGDATQLHQVLLNLSLNARDAMPRGGRLSIAVENTIVDDAFVAMHVGAKVGVYVLMTVSDTGTGIPETARDRIFEPFFTTKAFGKGTGLGLPTTLSIVKSHGGFVTMDTEVGVGTTFRVYLPATMSPAATGLATTEVHALAGHGELVLVVDDEASVRNIVRRTLERGGYQVCMAGDGAEAVAIYAARRNEIALVLTDMSMPVMDGPALIAALRTITPSVVVIGSSGQPAAQGIDVPFLSKPYTADVLLRAIDQALHSAKR